MSNKKKKKKSGSSQGNQNTKSNKKQPSKFEQNKKQIFILCGIAAVVLIAVIVIVIVNSNRNSDPNDDTLFGNGESTLKETLSISEEEIYAGYFEEDIVDVEILCISGTPDCYTIDGNVVTFTSVTEDSVYSISGKLKGNIVIDTGDDYKFDLEMHGFSLVSDTANPIMINSGDEVSLTAKKDYNNYIYDMREAVASDDETLFSGAVYATVDLEIAGKGNLTVVSENNNGIHGKDDLQVKNLNLTVVCLDNALKGNDSVTIENATTSLIAKQGDGIKTTNTDVSEKGNQRGTVTITGGTHTIGAACDGIDAAYDVIVDDATTSLTIYTDKYSSSSEEVTATSDSTYYLRYTSTSYKFSVKYYNSDDDYIWVDVSDSYETVSSQSHRPGGSSTKYYYYTFAKKADYSKLAVYMYQSSQETGQDEDYYACSSYKTLNSNYDTVAVSYSSSELTLSWTNYTTTSSMGGGMMGGGMMGGMDGGNTDKGDYSTKGIKAGNEITINTGVVNIKAYDDAIHANKDSTLENGATPTGNVNILGGTVTVYSNDDGIHADGVLTVSGGTVTVENSYEGLEGLQIIVSDGSVSVHASDDGFNSTATSGTGIEISGGKVYVYCTGDGLDSNTKSSYSGIVFTGGETVVISNSTGNSALDTENGYKYEAGSVVAIMPQRGMASEATHCSNFSSIGTYKSVSLSSGKTVNVEIKNSTISVTMPCSMSAYVIVLGDKSASVSTN